jgi:hypothetical protein
MCNVLQIISATRFEQNAIGNIDDGVMIYTHAHISTATTTTTTTTDLASGGNRNQARS